MDEPQVSELLTRQHGVIARRQVLAAGGSDVDIERLIRRREWAQVHPGVYVTHTGPLTPFQAGWAAVLRCWPAVLAGASAMQAYGLRTGHGDGGHVEVAVEEGRRVSRSPGILVSRLSAFADLAQLHLSPPRVRLEHAVLTVASRASTADEAVAVIGDACQTRRTTARLLAAALAPCLGCPGDGCSPRCSRTPPPAPGRRSTAGISSTSSAPTGCRGRTDSAW